MSGHGFSPTPQRGCLFAANAQERLSFNVHATGWLNWLQDSGYFREYVLWMDCCMNRLSFLQPRDPPLPPVNASEPPRAGFVAFAAKRNCKAVELPIPEDSNKPHGVFTWALLEGLRGAAADANGRVSGRGLADWIRNAQVARMRPTDLQDHEVGQEPEVIREDAALIFARGVSKPFHQVTLNLPGNAVGAQARIWTGAPPRVIESLTVTAQSEVVSLQPGLYLIEVASAGLRQGFEVLKSTNVAVKDQGPEVIESPPGTVFQLRVDPQDPTAEIFVIDSQFGLVDSASGVLTTPLPFGLFKVKTRTSRSTGQQVVLIDRNRPSLDPATLFQPVATVVPIMGTAASHEYQAAGVQDARNKIDTLKITRGKSGLMVMVRAFSDSNSSVTGTRPWQGVSVVDTQGETVLDLEQGDIREHGDAFAFAVAAMQPGCYFLRQKLDDGTTLEQSLILCKGWIHEVYVLRLAAPGEERLRHRPRVSVLMRKVGHATASDKADQLIDTARVALADERRILNTELEAVLLQKFSDPMAGIIGGHLLLVERERDPDRDLSLLDTVVDNLHGMVGKSHPDVAALALQCQDPRLRNSVRGLSGPPMFQRSWNLLAAAAQRRPKLIPVEMWERVQALSALPPFLAWSADAEVKSAAAMDLARAVLGDSVELEAMTDEATSFSLSVPSGVPRDIAGGLFEGVVRGAGAAGAQLTSMAKSRAARMNLPPSALESLKARRK